MMARWLLPFLAAGGFIGFLELADYAPIRLNWYGFLAAVWPILFFTFFLLERRRRHLSIHNLAFPFLALLSGAVLLFVYVDRPVLRQVVIFLSGFMVFLNLFCLDFSLRQSVRAAHFLERCAVITCSLALFYLFVALFGWAIFLANTFWPVVLLAFGIGWLLSLEYLVAEGVTATRAGFISLVLGLLGAEFFWIISLWPVGFLVKGWILTLIMVNFLAIAASYIQKKVDKKKLLANIAVSAVLIILVVSFARWL